MNNKMHIDKVCRFLKQSVCVNRDCRGNWSSLLFRKNTSRMSSATWRKNICMHRRKWSVSRACRWW